VPAEAIAEDLLGLAVERAPLDCSGMLLPAERRILVNAGEGAARQRFTVAHELGHWVYLCLEGNDAPGYCREQDVGLGPEAKQLEREANVFAAELRMPEDAVRAAAGAPDPATTFGVSGEAMGVAAVFLRAWPAAVRTTVRAGD
jgi:Zn-dependent peptidase ImmA (M78 family)